MTTQLVPTVQPKPNNLEKVVSPPRRPLATASDAMSLGRTHVEVFETMQTLGQPLTVRRIARLTKLPDADLGTALEALLELRLIARLNTIIESYVVRSPRGT